MSSTGDVPAQAIPLPEGVFRIPGRNSSALYELVFPVETLNPLTITTFELTRVTYKVQRPVDRYSTFQSQSPSHGRHGEDIRISNSKVKIVSN